VSDDRHRIELNIWYYSDSTQHKVSVAMSLTRTEVVRVADLARLRLSDGEIDAMQSQLSRILEHVSALQAVDVTGVEPTAQVTDLVNALRTDANWPSLDRAAAIRNSADTDLGMFRVKAVFEEQ
jgi:aspartyl-tRNA(Asn)/glutamyl-tRNA(Gln) amidotransferase subunit C